MRPSMARYREWSRRIWALVQRPRAARVEQVGIDEGYLDLTGAVATAGEAERFLRELQAADPRPRRGLDASLGCATCKVVAKIASDHAQAGAA